MVGGVMIRNETIRDGVVVYAEIIDLVAATFAVEEFGQIISTRPLTLDEITFYATPAPIPVEDEVVVLRAELASIRRRAAEIEEVLGVATVWRQPSGAHDAYPLGSRVTHLGEVWVSTTPANVWEPGVYGWVVASEVGEPGGGPYPWLQPVPGVPHPTIEGEHPYLLGARVTHLGATWESTHPGENVWEPGVFGWVQV
jgi:hypothetical protein